MDALLEFGLEIWEKALEPYIWDSLGFWRVLSLALLTFLLTCYLFRKRFFAYLRKAEFDAHDGGKFVWFNAFIQEKNIREFLADSSRTLVMNEHSHDHVLKYLQAAGLPENRFLHPQIAQAFAKFIQKLTGYMAVVDEQFNHSGNAYMFRHKAAIDLQKGTPRELRRYKKEAQKVQKKALACSKAFDDYRATVKKQLVL